MNKSLENYVNLGIQDSSHDEGIDRDFQLKRKEVGCIPVVFVDFSKSSLNNSTTFINLIGNISQSFI